MIESFRSYLAKTNLAKNTVRSYLWAVSYFLEHYKVVNKKNLLAYKGYLVEKFKPQTVNLRLQGINKYLEFTKQEKLKIQVEIRWLSRLVFPRVVSWSHWCTDKRTSANQSGACRCRLSRPLQQGRQNPSPLHS